MSNLLNDWGEICNLRASAGTAGFLRVYYPSPTIAYFNFHVHILLVLPVVIYPFQEPVSRLLGSSRCASKIPCASFHCVGDAGLTGLWSAWDCCLGVKKVRGKNEASTKFHRIHVSFTYMYHINWPNVGKSYTLSMDPMGGCKPIMEMVDLFIHWPPEPIWNWFWDDFRVNSEGDLHR